MSDQQQPEKAHLPIGADTAGRCLVCGEVVHLFLMGMHVEDHAQRGEFPISTPPGLAGEL